MLADVAHRLHMLVFLYLAGGACAKSSPDVASPATRSPETSVPDASAEQQTKVEQPGKGHKVSSDRDTPSGDASKSPPAEPVQGGFYYATAMHSGPDVTCTHPGLAGSSGDYDAKLVKKACVTAKGDVVAGPVLLITFDGKVVARAKQKNGGEIHSCQLLAPELFESIRRSRFSDLATACKP